MLGLDIRERGDLLLGWHLRAQGNLSLALDSRARPLKDMVNVGGRVRSRGRRPASRDVTEKPGQRLGRGEPRPPRRPCETPEDGPKPCGSKANLRASSPALPLAPTTWSRPRVPSGYRGRTPGAEAPPWQAREEHHFFPNIQAENKRVSEMGLGAQRREAESPDSNL